MQHDARIDSTTDSCGSIRWTESSVFGAAIVSPPSQTSLLDSQPSRHQAIEARPLACLMTAKS